MGPAKHPRRPLGPQLASFLAGSSLASSSPLAAKQRLAHSARPHTQSSFHLEEPEVRPARRDDAKWLLGKLMMSQH